MAKPKKKKPLPAAPVTHESMETFSSPFGYWLRQIKRDTPFCFNGMVGVRKYRVTAELIEEPNEVIAARIQHLWDVCDNWHHWDALKAAAQAVGYTIVGSAGSKLEKK